MAIFADTYVQDGFSVRIAETLKATAERMIQNHQYRTTVRELSALTSRDLADLGINASNIRQVAHDCAYGTKN